MESRQNNTSIQKTEIIKEKEYFSFIMNFEISSLFSNPFSILSQQF